MIQLHVCHTYRPNRPQIYVTLCAQTQIVPSGGLGSSVIAGIAYCVQAGLHQSTGTSMVIYSKHQWRWLRQTCLCARRRRSQRCLRCSRLACSSPHCRSRTMNIGLGRAASCIWRRPDAHAVRRIPDVATPLWKVDGSASAHQPTPSVRFGALALRLTAGSRAAPRAPERRRQRARHSSRSQRVCLRAVAPQALECGWRRMRQSSVSSSCFCGGRQHSITSPQSTGHGTGSLLGPP